MERSTSTMLITHEARVLTIFIKLLRRQRVNYEIVYEMYECSKRTMDRIIASIRDALDNSDIYYDFELIYNKKRNSYELIRVGLKSQIQLAL